MNNRILINPILFRFPEYTFKRETFIHLLPEKRLFVGRTFTRKARYYMFKRKYIKEYLKNVKMFGNTFLINECAKYIVYFRLNEIIPGFRKHVYSEKRFSKWIRLS